jgi:hypothetical protein
MAGTCKKVVIDIIAGDLADSDDGFVYISFVDCGGDDVVVGYNTAKLDFDTGYCMDTTRDYTAEIYVGGIPTAPPYNSRVTEGDPCSESNPVEIPPAVVPPAYGKKYTLSAVGKSGHTFTAEIYEKLYTGATYPINTSLNPFVLDCLASNDDPFQPILPTTFTIRADFTDFAGPFPDFLSTDDRKYFVKFYASGTTYLLWNGFILMDTISLPFTTGSTLIDIICVDAIGQLKSVTYLPGVPLLTSTESIVQTINNCLAYLLYPGGYKVNFAVNYYTSQLSDATSALRQIYVTQCNWQTGSDAYLTCYDIIEIICTAFGAQIYQSGGEWWITSVNERASNTIRVFQTDQDTSADVAYTKTLNYTIQPYQSDALTPFYFIDNSQTKILSKGFPIVEVSGDIDYNYNKLINGDFSKLSNITVPAPNGTPDNWTTTIGTSGSVNVQTTNGVRGLLLDAGSTNTVLVSTPVLIDQYDKVSLSFDGYGATGGATFLHIEIKIDVGSGNVYKYAKAAGADPEWLYNPSTSAGAYRYEVGAISNPQRITIDSSGAPASGTLEITFRVGTQIGGAHTEGFFGNARLTYTSQYSKYTFSNVNSSSPYKKEVTVKLGNYTVISGIVSRTQSQSLLTSANAGLFDWQRYADTSATYQTLATLLLSQYYNIFSKPRVNMSFTQYNVYNQAGDYFIGLVNNFAITDPSGTISISAFKYILGACTIDYVNNTISGTALQIANTNLTFSTKQTLTPNR